MSAIQFHLENQRLGLAWMSAIQASAIQAARLATLHRPGCFIQVDTRLCRMQGKVVLTHRIVKVSLIERRLYARTKCLKSQSDAK